MNIKRIKSIIMVIIFLTSIIIPSSITFAKKVDNTNENSNINPHVFKISKAGSKSLTKCILSKTFRSTFFKSTDNNDPINVVLANQPYDEYRPSIVFSGNDVLVAYETLEDKNTSIYFKTSSNYGQSWSQPNLIDTSIGGTRYNAISPIFTRISTGGASGFFGTFLTPENSSYVFEVDSFLSLWDYTNIQDADGYIGDFYGFKTPDVVTYTETNIPWVIGVIGKGDFIEKYDEYDCNDCPMFLYRDTDNIENQRTIVFYPEITGCSNISLCSEEGEGGNLPMVYGVCEINNDTNKDLLFFYGNKAIWENIDSLQKYQIRSSENLLHPKIYAKDNDIYIVAENSSKQIIMYHSDDYTDNSSWVLKNVTSNILSNDSEPGYPELYIYGSDIMCSFIESGNFSFTKSNNSGLSWSEPYQLNFLNGSVQPGYRYSDIGDFNRLVWTDNRGGNLDIYLYIDYFPEVDLELLNINLSSDLHPLKTNNTLKIKIRNKGDGLAENIKVNVTFEFADENKSYLEPDIDLAFMAPHETREITRFIYNFKMPDVIYALIEFSDIENITVKVDPDYLTGDIDKNNNIGKRQVSFDEIFLGFKGLQPFFILLKRLFFSY